MKRVELLGLFLLGMNGVAGGRWQFWKRRTRALVVSEVDPTPDPNLRGSCVEVMAVVSAFLLVALISVTLLSPPKSKERLWRTQILRESAASFSIVATSTLLGPTVASLSIPGEIPPWLSNSLSQVVAMEVSAGAFGNPANSVLFMLTHRKPLHLVAAEIAAQLLGATVAYEAFLFFSCQEILSVDVRGPEFASGQRQDAFAAEFATAVLMSFAVLAMRVKLTGKHLLKQALRATWLCLLFVMFPSAGLAANPAISLAWEIAKTGVLPRTRGFYVVYVLGPMCACVFVALTWSAARSEMRIAVPARVQGLQDQERTATLTSASPARRTRTRPPVKPRQPSKPTMMESAQSIEKTKLK